MALASVPSPPRVAKLRAELAGKDALLESTRRQLHQAEMKLWGLSLHAEREGGQMFLPPKLLAATLEEARAARREATMLPPPTRGATSARASSRDEAVALAAAVRREVSAGNDSLSVWDSAFEEMVRQVGSHCAERGELLGKVRAWFIRHVWWLERQLEQQKERCADAEARLEEWQRTGRGGAPHPFAHPDRRQPSRKVLRDASLTAFPETASHSAADDSRPPSSHAYSTSSRHLRATPGRSHIGPSQPAGHCERRRGSGSTPSGELTQDAILRFYEKQGDNCIQLLADLVFALSDDTRGEEDRSHVRRELAMLLLEPIESEHLEPASRAGGDSTHLKKVEEEGQRTKVLQALTSMPAEERSYLLADSMANASVEAASTLVSHLLGNFQTSQRHEVLESIIAMSGEDEWARLRELLKPSSLEQGTQTGGHLDGWPRVLNDLLELEPEARVKLYSMVTMKERWAPAELQYLSDMLQSSASFSPPYRGEERSHAAHPTSQLGGPVHPTRQLGNSIHPTSQLGNPVHPTRQLGNADHSTRQLASSNHPTRQLGNPDHSTRQLGSSDHPTRQLGNPDYSTRQLGSSDHPTRQLGNPDHPTRQLSNAEGSRQSFASDLKASTDDYNEHEESADNEARDDEAARPAQANAKSKASKKPMKSGKKEKDILTEASRNSLHPEEMLLRVIGEVWATKIAEEARRGSGRSRMKSFLRDFFLRQYGVRQVAVQTVGNFLFSLRSLLGSEMDEASETESRVLENRARLELFAAMCGLAGDSQEEWLPHKISFFLTFIQNVLGRDQSWKTTNARGGGDAASKDFLQGLKERLTKKRVMVKLSSVTNELPKVVIGLSERQSLIEYAQAMVVEDTESKSMIDLDSYCNFLMQVWEEGERNLARMRSERLHELLTQFSVADHEHVSFEAFEQVVNLLLRGDANPVVGDNGTSAESGLYLLDMFDEALQQTASQVGEDSEEVNAAAMLTVIERSQLADALIPRIFTDGHQPILKQVDVRESKLDGALTEESFVSRDTRRLSAPLPCSPAKVSKQGSSAQGKEKKSRCNSPARRQSLSTSSPATSWPKETPNSQVYAAMKNNFLFKHLPADAFAKLLDRMEKVDCVAGKVIFNQGDKGDFFYVVASGEFVVHKDGNQEHLYQVEGDHELPCFGELALLYGKPRAATVTCVVNGTLWALDRIGFREAQKTSRDTDVIEILSKVELLKALNFGQLQLLRDKMVRKTFEPGERVIVEGETGHAFYVITAGSAKVTRKRAEHTRRKSFQRCLSGRFTYSIGAEVSSAGLPRAKPFYKDLSNGARADDEEIGMLSVHTCFGESALITNCPRNATVTACGDGPLHTLMLDRSTFEKVLGPLSEIVEAANAERDRISKQQIIEQQASGLSDAHLGSFRLSKVVRDSAGTSKFYLVKHAIESQGSLLATQRKLYTLRAESKSAMDSENMKAFKKEMDLATKVHSNVGSTVLPHIITQFQDEKGLYTLYSCRAIATVHEMRTQHSLDEACILFVLACVASALRLLHEQQIVLRGVAAWLLMINDSGYVSVIDLSHASKLTGGSFSISGPPQIVAPEQVRGQAHSFPVDYWALGALGYYLAQGHLPFSNDDDTSDESFLRVARSVANHSPNGLTFDEPSSLGDEAQNLLQMLMHPDQTARPGAQDFVQHLLFENISWQQLDQCRLSFHISWESLDYRSPLAEHTANLLLSNTSQNRRAPMDEVFTGFP